MKKLMMLSVILLSSMAYAQTDSNIIDLTEATSADVNSIVYVVLDPDGTPLDRKMTIYNMISFLIRTYLEPYGAADANMVTHIADYNHLDIATALQPSDIRSTIEPYGAADANMATHLADYNHADIGTSLQTSAIGTTVQAYDSNLPDFPTDPDADKFLKWDDTNSVLVWADANSSATGTGDMLLATYDTLENGFVDGNDTEYGDDWDSNPDAPSMNAVYDKFESVVSGTVGFASSDSITFTIVDGNLVPDVNDTWFADNVPTGTDVNDLITLSGLPSGSTDYGTSFTGTTIPDDSNTLVALQALETAVEAGSGGIWNYWTFTIPDPHSYYDSNSIFPVDVNLANNITIAQVITSCDKVPSSELDLDLKYADDRTLANAALIGALDTTSGASTVTSFTDATVDATKWVYLKFATQPVNDIDFVTVSIKYSSLSTVYDYFSQSIVEPNEVYDVNAMFPVYSYMGAASTVDQVIIECDINPTTEPNITFFYADNFITKANEVQMFNITLTDGTATVESFDDATVPAGKVIYGIFQAAPDADIKWISIKGRKSND